MLWIALALNATALAEDLQVTSNVVGATIYVDGVEEGMLTPGTVYGLSPGPRNVRVVKGCYTGQAMVDVVTGQISKVNVPASEGTAKLSAWSQPAGATIFLDGSPYPGPPGVPVQVTCGPHVLEARLSGYATVTAEVEAFGGDTATVPFTLQKLGLGQIDLAVKPTQALIRIDGRKLGTDTVMLPAVDEGLHTISAELDGRNPVSADVWVEAGDRLAYQFKLTRGDRRPSQVIPYGDVSTAAVAEAAKRKKSGQLTVAVDPPVAAAAAKAEETARKKAEEDAAKTVAAQKAAAEKAAAEKAAAEKAPASTTSKAAETTAAKAAADKAASDKAASDKAAADKAAADKAASDKAAADKAASDKAAADKAASGAAAADKAAADKAAREKSSDKKSTEKADNGREENPMARVVGWSMTGVGVLTGVGAFFAYDAAYQDWQTYEDMKAAAEKSEERKKQLNEQATAWYDEEVVPARHKYYFTAGLTGALLVGGVSTLTIAALMDGGPSLTVMPGSVTLGWRF